MQFTNIEKGNVDNASLESIKKESEEKLKVLLKGGELSNEALAISQENSEIKNKSKQYAIDWVNRYFQSKSLPEEKLDGYTDAQWNDIKKREDETSKTDYKQKVSSTIEGRSSIIIDLEKQYKEKISAIISSPQLKDKISFPGIDLTDPKNSNYIRQIALDEKLGVNNELFDISFIASSIKLYQLQIEEELREAKVSPMTKASLVTQKIADLYEKIRYRISKKPTLGTTGIDQNNSMRIAA
ncbi:hypothetical protein A2914_01105 [Candidatus Nomurabacteria bacterium RIFCSPLOWO2_01_FULL_41_21]|uniref:Uncharacterized protein n=2 Tax=Candidatus Nomuraibacteriota TaxID=1752729 RepID=A0A1F6V247_9BACT|nr:MAG: hypothetical protein A2733_02195 [Candidatus Nomurabacteria bacterium RIFCSPHIGHO2_01_FULL_40_20]OGI87911.1 MAG: hypothetical protein A2914_01105 [Candidatus Nomurabacteria bacterium RIFCSPLOWO2_01_FULL_41_21]